MKANLQLRILCLSAAIALIEGYDEGYESQSDCERRFGKDMSERSFDENKDGGLTFSELIEKWNMNKWKWELIKREQVEKNLYSYDNEICQFDETDLNSNGRITRDEWKNYCKAIFEFEAMCGGNHYPSEIFNWCETPAWSLKMKTAEVNLIDTNWDGSVTTCEYIAYKKNMLLFNGLDSDGNGVITPDELKSRALFDIVDHNTDEKITKGEWANYRYAMAEFNLRDKNRDGKLTGETMGYKALLNEVDKNKDGAIAFDEFAKLPLTDWEKRDKRRKMGLLTRFHRIFYSPPSI